MKNAVILFYPKTEKENVNKNIPLAILKVGSQLKGAGYDVITIDERFEENYENRLKKALDNAICFGVSVMTGYQIGGGLNASRFVKRIDKNISVIWGGWHPSILPEETLTNENIDIVVRGQGEQTMEEAVDVIKDKRNLKDIGGIGYKENGKVILNKCRAFQDINEFYPISFDILNIESYIFKGPLGKRSIFWNSSQGCPYRCGFCCTPTVYERRWSGLEAEKIVEQVRILVNDYKVNAVTFAEDNFFVDLKRIEKLCKGFIENNFNINWVSDIRIDRVNQLSDEFMLLLKKSGCVKLFIGAESGDEEVLSLIDKKINVSDNYKAAEKLARHKIVTDFFVVVGFPGDPEKDLKETLKMISDIKALYPDHQFTPLIFTPYPGIPLMKTSIKHGLKVPDRLEGWVNWSVLSVNTPWISRKYLDKVNMYAKYLYPLAFPSSSLKNKLEKRLLGLPYRTLREVARFRINRHFFGFPAEWKLLLMFHKLRARFKLLENVESFR